MNKIRERFEKETGNSTICVLGCSEWEYVKAYIRWLEKQVKLEQDKNEIRQLIKEQ